MRFEELPIEKVELDYDNPRIKQYLEMYKTITSETLSLALSGSSGTDSSGKYRALRDSIKENKGIFTPIIVNHITETDKYVVIEGNTRLKFYLEFNEKEPNTHWAKIISIVYDDMSEDSIHQIRLQAHMVGARDWDAFSKAKYLDYLYNTEKKSMNFLKNFCGGQESQIRNLIDGYQDMQNSYIPYCNDNGEEFDPQVFSYYVELQKSSAKDSLIVHGYDLSDFTKWVVNENIERAEAVRKLAKVLGDAEARKEFLKSNIGEALKKLDIKESDEKKLNNINVYDLAKAVSKKLDLLPATESVKLKKDPKFSDKLEILKDLQYSINETLRIIEEE